jgi:hypothetical protein
MESRQDQNIRPLLAPAKTKAAPGPARDPQAPRNDFFAAMRRVEAEVYDAA